MLADMETLSFDGYTTYSEDSSAPRTPSPRSDVPYAVQTQIYDDDSHYRPSLLHELYAHEEEYPKQQQQHQQQQHQPPMPRRNTFPYARHDAPPSYPSAYDAYDDAGYVVPSSGPAGHPYYHQQQYIQHQHHHHPYGPPSSGGPGMLGPMAGMAGIGYPHLPAPLPIQHTDDAASKETQYLRRRCFNCHTTEPPSWRRSTLNPGKIVCNKCGLYERTHLRPRPLRFDELRAGGKARKNSLSNGSSAGKTSPKSPGKNLIKKESVERGLGGPRARRSSVSSNGGSNSDWDDNARLYPIQPDMRYPYDSPYSPTYPPNGYVTSSPTHSPTFTPSSEAYGSPYHSPYSHSSASPPDSAQLTLPPIIHEEPSRAS
ncbi:hypothetical protein BDP27DRAFT_1074000 [Rhodocollybia butyracea]|uniref:GATA-type domain-containing protein n=1 Tax=Rhodocollybia butyracea TaxID=206335 RepID=A0A9P5P4U2_9AGAR|nr:hypothetical protein BDP27DRAFT_1074000 [Rhodocollybia butyracea]